MPLDRTAEFQRIIATRRAQQQQAHPKSTQRVPIKRSEFAAAASQIGADISNTANKLSKLTQLAQSQSLFEDPTVEINELTHILKQDITSLNSKLASLQGAMAAARTGGAKQHATHSTSVVDSLKKSLLDATKEFQDVLHTRSHNIQLLQSRREQFSFQPSAGAGTSAIATPTGAAARGPFGGGGFGSCGTPGSSVPPPAPIFELGVAPTAGQAGSSAEGGFGGGSSGGGSFGGADGAPDEACEGAVWASPAAKPLGLSQNDGEVVIDMSGLQQQQQQLVPASSSYYDSRAQAVESVQSTIVELGGIFEQLAVMVAEQGTLLQRVDENVDVSLDNVRGGHEALQTYLTRMSTNRALMMKIFGVLFFFIVVWGTLFA